MIIISIYSVHVDRWIGECFFPKFLLEVPRKGKTLCILVCKFPLLSLTFYLPSLPATLKTNCIL